MSNSPLVNYTKLSPNCTTPRNHIIDTITIHCMAGNLTVESCGALFAPSSRQASSNYGVGTDGRVALYVDEANRSWCTSSGTNDHRAVTIEVANDGGAPDWHVSDKALAALTDLVADICKRNGIKQLVWRPDKNNPGNMTVHRWFAAKACPGDYLFNLHGQIAANVNKKLGTPADTSAADTLALAVKYAVPIIAANEGSYSTCVKNDNGALSVGEFCWHASRALMLLKTVISANNPNAKKILGDAFYSEIMSAATDAWETRVLTDAEVPVITALLQTPESKTAQDNLANTDVTAYVKKGQSYGLTDCGALIYFADGVNQYGTNSTLWKSIAEVALKSAGDAAAMFAATKAQTQNYLDRRERVVNKIAALNLNGAAPPAAAFAPYTVRVTANALNYRKGPGTNYGIAGVISDKGVYTITEEAAGAGASKWGKLKSGAGWISLDYT
ncbi:MAG: N-acetylmuramoyl-L-alanine amidase, partial [Oscillospiraceae bacterium]|nr:N-acetylmuramoyl-L-alanine amidase [Oscillospiraceae bacterium]